jgi:hypothetical protein
MTAERPRPGSKNDTAGHVIRGEVKAARTDCVGLLVANGPPFSSEPFCSREQIVGRRTKPALKETWCAGFHPTHALYPSRRDSNRVKWRKQVFVVSADLTLERD